MSAFLLPQNQKIEEKIEDDKHKVQVQVQVQSAAPIAISSSLFRQRLFLLSSSAPAVSNKFLITPQ